MRIFQLNTFCGVKSTGRIAGEIAKLVQADGGECRIGYGVPGISDDSQRFALRIGTPAGRKVHAALRKLFDAEGYGSLMATVRLISEMERFQPDLIQLHNVHGCYLHLPTLFRYFQKKDLPIVWTLHDCWPFTGHCAYFDYAGCERWKTQCHHCPQQKSYPVCIGLDGSKRNHRMKRKFFSMPRRMTFVAPCEWMAGRVKDSKLAKYPVKVIVNGVNLKVFHPVQSDVRIRYGLQNKRLCLSVASEWDQRKGLPFLLEAAQRMGESYTFVVIGLSDEQLASLPSNMLGIRHTADTEELAAWYTAADCLVNPTLEDNMPMVNLEALACGTPVVVFETGGCPEVVDRSCGMVVPKGDLQALCAAVETAANGAFKPQNCIARAQQFDCEQTFQNYLALYKELVP
ncbi:MAG: glycosyltransferase [Clostridia bacterium]|nr:glycosyltransferase [Clostridia bacterium]